MGALQMGKTKCIRNFQKGTIQQNGIDLHTEIGGNHHPHGIKITDGSCCRGRYCTRIMRK